MNKNMLAVALASLLVGGVAVAAFNSFRSNDSAQASVTPEGQALDGQSPSGDVAANGAIQGGKVQYADVTSVKPITEKEKLYATVIGTDPVRETSTVSTPREVCEDKVVTRKKPVKDTHQVTGTVIGAVAGGLLGDAIGGGGKNTAAKIAGAAAGGYE